MNEVKLRGKFLGASEIKEVGTKGTKFRSFWVDVSDNPQYPNTPEVQLMNDKCTLVDKLTKGVEIEVSGRLKGRKAVDKEGNDVVYTNVEAWSIQVIQRTSAAFVGNTPVEPAAPQAPAPVASEDTFAGAAPLPKKSGLPF